jgi:Heterokaryon incompatibility protein Het-C
MNSVVDLLGNIPGSGGLAQEARDLQRASMEQEQINESTRASDPSFPGPPAGPPGPGAPAGQGGGPAPGIPGMSSTFDPVATAKKIYPILEFRDKIAKAVSATIEKIPGLESLVEKITETITLFILSLLAPFVRPIITAVSKSMKTGSSTVVESSAQHQYEPWTDPHCTDPTHSLLSKDHFSNILNEPAGQVASAILQYVAPRVIYAWEHPDVPVEQVLKDVTRAFHHPAIRDRNCELHNKMFDVVERWSRSTKHPIDRLLSPDSVRRGDNHLETTQQQQGTGSHGGLGVWQQSGSGGIGVPNTNQLSNLLSQAASSRFGGGSMNMFGKVTKMAGLTRGGEELNLEAEAAHIEQEYPGTQTGFDNRSPPPTQQLAPQPPFAGEGGYDPYRGNSPAPPRQEFYGYGPPPPPGEYQGGYQGGPPMGMYPGAPPPGPMGYPEAPPGPYPGGPPPPPGYGYDPNAPPPPGYGYGGPPPQGYY